EGTKSSRNAMGGAVLVISETRKPSSGSYWGKSIADFMGSARLPYAVDAALLFRWLDNADGIANYNWPSFPHQAPTFQDFSGQGITPVVLELAKGRDGMRRGHWALEYHHEQSRFIEATSGVSGDLDACFNASQCGSEDEY